MTSRGTVQYRVTDRSVEFLTAPGAVYLAAQRTGTATMRSPRDRSVLLIPVNAAADVLADLGRQGRRLEHVGAVLA